nr:hypothetical protein [uncultured Noviherbaspirillum sp.]
MKHDRIHRLAQATLAALTLLAASHAQALTAAGTAISNQASATYTDAASTARTVNSNTVVTVVQQVGSLTMSSNGAKNAAPGSQVSYPHTITNTGNGPDSFLLSAANSGAFSYGAVQFYADANGDGVADNATPIVATDTIAAGATYKFVAVGTVPANVPASATNDIVLTAASVFAPGSSTVNTDTTTASTVAGVDMTGNAPGAGAPGAGAGPEASPIISNAVNPGGTTRYTLYLNNGGNAPDTYNLQASTDGSFGAVTLPPGWTVVFKDGSGSVITSSTVPAGGNSVVYADVTPPSGAVAATSDLYFRAAGNTSGASDRMHVAAIVLPSAGQVALIKSQALDANCDGVADVAFVQTNITAGAVPGACIRYQITASNVSGSNVTALVITDPTPGSTTYHATRAASVSVGTVTAPAGGSAGNVQATVGTLTPAQSALLEFGVRINP